MARLVNQGRVNVKVRMLALALVQDLKQKDYLGEAMAVHAFVRDNIRYVRDVRGVETLHTAEQILDQRAGDCDDKTVLVAALLETIGHKTRLVAVGMTPGTYCHVYPEVNIRGRWYPVETTENWPFGEMRITPAARMEQNV
jgi:transglutaminase-like putative cysteine protease